MDSAPRLDLSGVPAPLSPTHDDCLCAVWQAGVGYGARRRRCLLKGCSRRFRPLNPLSRYCSEACREAARIWSRRRAEANYRQTEAGREKRRAQSRRYRKRVRLGCVAHQRQSTPTGPRPPDAPAAAPLPMACPPTTPPEPTQPVASPVLPTPKVTSPTVTSPTVKTPAAQTPVVKTPKEALPPEGMLPQACFGSGEQFQDAGHGCVWRNVPPSRASGESCESCEGHHPPGAEKNFFCQRPGCYEQFVLSPRSPGQKFCSPLCRQALRRVERREAFWCQRLRELSGTGPPGRMACASRAGCRRKS